MKTKDGLCFRSFVSAAVQVEADCNLYTDRHPLFYHSAPAAQAHIISFRFAFSSSRNVANDINIWRAKNWQKRNISAVFCCRCLQRWKEENQITSEALVCGRRGGKLMEILSKSAVFVSSSKTGRN